MRNAILCAENEEILNVLLKLRETSLGGFLHLWLLIYKPLVESDQAC